MTDFFKKILPERSRRQKPVIQDIVPKRKNIQPAAVSRLPAAEPKRAQAEPPVSAIEPPQSMIQKLRTELRKTAPQNPKEEFNVNIWEPQRPKIADFSKIFTKKRIAVAGGIAIFLSLVVILSTKGAALTLTLRPVSAKIPIPSTEITADVKVNSPNQETRKIPGLKIVTEQTYQKSFPSSGRKYVEDYARGRLNVFNAYSSAPQILISGTRFIEPSGKIFKLTKTVTVPGARIEEGKIIPSAMETEVAAEKPGQDYNIGPSNFSIPGFKGTPKYDAFYGKSSSLFDGGFKGETKVVTSGDIKSAEVEVTRELFNQLKSSLHEKTPSGDEFAVLDGSRSILIVEVNSPKQNERKDEFAVSARGTGEIFVFKNADLTGLLSIALLSPDRPSTLITDSAKLAFKNVRLDAIKGELKFTVEGEALGVRTMPVDEIKSVAVAKRITMLENYLRNRPEIAGFVINNFPFWRWRTPSDPRAIEIKIELPNN